MTDAKEYTEEEIRDSFNSGYTCGMEQGEELGRKQTIDRILEIIDKTYDEYARHLPIEEFGRGSYLTGQIKEAVLALKGGEQG